MREVGGYQYVLMIQQDASILLTDAFQFAYFLPIRCNLLCARDSWYPAHSIGFSP
jgi:hypothetical protein